MSQEGCTSDASDANHCLLDLPDATHAAALHVDLEPELLHSILGRTKAILLTLMETTENMVMAQKKNKGNFYLLTISMAEFICDPVCTSRDYSLGVWVRRRPR